MMLSVGKSVSGSFIFYFEWQCSCPTGLLVTVHFNVQFFYHLLEFRKYGMYLLMLTVVGSGDVSVIFKYTMSVGGGNRDLSCDLDPLQRSMLLPSTMFQKNWGSITKQIQLRSFASVQR